MKGFRCATLLSAVSILSMFCAGCGGAKRPEGTVVFQRTAEPREQAFTVLVPEGWTVEGGIVRVDPTAQGGPAQSIASKVDFAILRDRQGSAMIRWLPDTMYFDPKYSPAAQMGLMPHGGNYQGMKILPVPSPTEFLKREIIPALHPTAGDLRVTDEQPLREIAERYERRVAGMIPGLRFSYDAGSVTVEYEENGIRYTERIFAVIEDWGQAGAGMWANKETFGFRAPAAEFAGLAPLFATIAGSVQINPQWLAAEMRGQRQRAKTVANVQREVQQIEQQILEHRRRTNEEIQNDMFLNLMGQEEYVNPYTGETEVGTDQWAHRWVNKSGDVIYSDRDDYDPNQDSALRRGDFKRTPVRKRFPQ